MSLYRVVARADLANGEVRPYDPGNGGGAATKGVIVSKELRQVRFDSLDLVDLGSHLMLVAAHEKAHAIIAAAEKEAERIREQARETAYQEGREQAKQEILPSVVAFGDAGQTLIIFEEELIDRYTPHLVGLALEIAEKIVGRAVDAEPDIVASVLERAKREVAEAKQVRIWLHPADHKVLLDIRPELIRSGNIAGRVIEVLAADDISRGGCRIETEMGLIDATLPTQIAEIRRQLLDEEPVSNGAYTNDQQS